MLKKSEQTSQFIIETVAPVFNKKGYSGTSLADITKSTGLTKGAIYGNFKDKYELATKAFIFNINYITSKIEIEIKKETKPIQQLLAVSNFYRGYNQHTRHFGGCPLLNIGVDANHQNPKLLEKVKKAIQNIQNSIVLIIKHGIKINDIQDHVNPDQYARKIFMLIEGAAFLSNTTKDEIYLKDMADALDHLILNELKL